MHLVQLLIPLRDGDGRPLTREFFEQVRGELTERFGGVTAYERAPAEGRWRDHTGAIEPDEIVIVEVMCSVLDCTWWASYRARLERELGQEQLVARALPIEML